MEFAQHHNNVLPSQSVPPMTQEELDEAMDEMMEVAPPNSNMLPSQLVGSFHGTQNTGINTNYNNTQPLPAAQDSIVDNIFSAEYMTQLELDTREDTQQEMQSNQNLPPHSGNPSVFTSPQNANVLQNNPETPTQDPFSQMLPNHLFEQQQQQQEAQSTFQIQQAQLASMSNFANAGAIAGPSSNPQFAQAPNDSSVMNHGAIAGSSSNPQRRVVPSIVRGYGPVRVGINDWTTQEEEILLNHSHLMYIEAEQLIMSQLRDIGSRKSRPQIRDKFYQLIPRAIRNTYVNRWDSDEEEILKNYLESDFKEVADQIKTELEQLGYLRSKEAIYSKLKTLDYKKNRVPKVLGSNAPRYCWPEKFRQMIQHYIETIPNPGKMIQRKEYFQLRDSMIEMDPRFPKNRLHYVVKQQINGMPWRYLTQEQDNDIRELLELHKGEIDWICKTVGGPRRSSTTDLYKTVYQKARQHSVYGFINDWSDAEKQKLLDVVHEEESKGTPVDWKLVKDPMIGRSLESCMRMYERMARHLWTREQTHQLLQQLDNDLIANNLMGADHQVNPEVYDQEFRMIAWDEYANLIEGSTAILCELRYRAFRDKYMCAKIDKEDDYIPHFEFLNL